MTHRERFYKAVTHQEIDRPVFDLAGCSQTLVDGEQVRADLARLCGATGEKQGNFNLDNRVLTALDIDTRFVGGMPFPDTGLARRENGMVYDAYGIGYRQLGAHQEIAYNPLKDAEIDEIMAYPLPQWDKIDQHYFDAYAEEAKYLHENTDYAVIATHPVLGVFEIACWMFGFDDWLYRLAGEPETVHAFSQKILDYQLGVADRYYGALGKYIDGTSSGDDFGMQTGPFMSTAMFDEFIAPYMKQRIARTKQHTDAFYQHHTCGSVFNFIPSLIDCGVDILNPIQPGVHNMEPERLKSTYGDKIAFWGGIDTQHLLPQSTPEEIKAEVKRVVGIMNQNGGYILSPAHTVQSDVPAENVMAIYQYNQ